MRLRSILILGASMALAATGMSEGIAQPAAGGISPSRTLAPHRWGPRHDGRWHAGWRAPGGWSAYRRPVRGFILPRYWISPAFLITNYGAYGLPAPTRGYGWSRYYDDAVMTDRYGRVYDYRSDVDWGRYEGGYDDGDAVATTANDYEGRWTGTWRGADGKSYSGTYEGRFEGTAESRYGVDYDAPPYQDPAAPGAPVVTTTYGPGGYVAGGYYYPAPIVTTVTVQPAVTTTTTTTTYVTEKVAYRKPARRKARSCRCK